MTTAFPDTPRSHEYPISGENTSLSSTKGPIKPFEIPKLRALKIVIIKADSYVYLVKAIVFLALSVFLKISQTVVTAKALSSWKVSINDQQKQTLKAGLIYAKAITNPVIKDAFGNQLLVSTVNASRIDISSEKERSEIIKKLNTMNKDPRFAKVLLKQPINQEKLISCSTQGVCWGFSMECIFLYLKAKRDRESIGDEGMEQIARSFVAGAPLEAATMQGLYAAFADITISPDEIGFPLETLKFGLAALDKRISHSTAKEKVPSFVKLIDCMVLLSKFCVGKRGEYIPKFRSRFGTPPYLDRIEDIINSQNSPQDARKDLTSEEKAWLSELVEFSINGYPSDKVLSLLSAESEESRHQTNLEIINIKSVEEGLGVRETADSKIREQVGWHHLYHSTREQIQNIGNLPPGAYHIDISVANSAHSIALIKEKDVSFIFDPNIGLIKSSSDLAQDLLKLIYTYPPPVSTVTSNAEKSKDPNYKLQIYGYSLSRGG